MDSLRLLARAFDLLRYGNLLAGQSERRLSELLREMLIALGPEPPSTTREMARLLRQWGRLGGRAYDDIDRMLRDLPELASLYREAAGRDVGRTVGDRSVSPDVVGLPVDRWTREQLHSLNLRTEAQLRQARLAGENSGQVAERLEKVVAQRKREMATLMRTAVTRTAQAGYEAGLKAAGVERYRYVAIMDTRTTREGGWNDVGCWGANDHVFRFDDPEAPRPGWHWNCRSHIEPVTGEPEGFATEAIRRAGLDVEGVRRAGEELQREGRLFTGERSNIRELIQAQPLGVRVEVLGNTGARRFGVGLSLSTIAARETSTLTLEELRARL